MESPRISRNGHDRISDLPEHLLHHIMSFLPKKDAVKTSILSKTWNSTWRSVPCLKFNQFTFQESAHRRKVNAKKSLQEFCHYVDNCLLTRRARIPNVTLDKFEVSVYNFQSCKRLDRKLDGWLDYAIESNVKHLAVAYYASSRLSKKDGWRYVVPDQVFKLAAVETLDLFGCQFKIYSELLTNGVNGIGFPQLRKLSLSHVRIDQETLQNLVSNSPLLEELNISFCDGFLDVRITAPKLLMAELYLSKGHIQIMGINAPNLVSLSYAGGPVEGLQENLMAFSKFKNLKELTLHHVDITDEFFGILTESPDHEKLDLKRSRIPESVRILRNNGSCKLGEFKLDKSCLSTFRSGRLDVHLL